MTERYQFHEKIGQGGLGEVYRATDLQLKREVTIKRLIPLDKEDIAKSYGGVSPSNLLGEATTLSALQHPNIVTVYDVGMDSEGCFVVMELLRGETFDKTVERGALNEMDFKRFVLQTMEGLVAAHHSGIVHRDLKPSNLMVNYPPSGKFQIKILDFGLAKFSNQPTVQTTDHGDGILGSIYFMAPEQFERIELDERTDLYSMGAIYHYCLTGQYPFNGSNAPEVIAAHLQGKVRPIGEIRTELSDWVSDWIMWLMNRNPDNRPQSSRQALEMFNKQMHANTTPEEKTSVPIVPQKKLAVTPQSSSGAPPVIPANVIAQSSNEGVIPSQPLPDSEDFQGFEVPIDGGEMKKFPVPVWVLITVPVCLIFLLFVVIKKSGDKKIVDQRNELILSLNQSEDPEGNKTIVKEFITFMKVQPDTEKGRNNVSGAMTTLMRLKGGDEVDQEIVSQMSSLSNNEAKIRSGLIGVIIDRGYVGGVPALIKQIKDGSSEVSSAAIYGVGELGDGNNLTALLSELEEATGKKADAIESSIVRISLKNSDIENRNKEIRRVLIEEGPIEEHRQRILRILGYLGGKSSWDDLKIILNGNDQEARKAVLQSLGSWPNGDPLETLNNLIKNEKDNIIRAMALRAYTPLLSAPSYVSDEKKTESIKELYEIGSSRNDKRNLIGVLALLATDEAQQFAETLAAKDDNLVASYGELAYKRISENLSKVSTIKEDLNVLRSSKALIFGEGAFEFDATDGAVKGWSNAQYYLVWPVNFSETGSYDISVNAAIPSGGGGEFEVVLAGGRGTARTVKNDEYADIPVGTFEVKNPGTYRVIISGITIDQKSGQLMNLRSVTLKSK
jgi:serine/threonine protein kinase